MCEYPELRILEGEPIMRAMEAQQLKSLVESGHYKPDPSRVAVAMLRRRGVRELLTVGQSTLSQAGRSQSSSVGPPRAA
jgi:hypothetical protein